MNMNHRSSGVVVGDRVQMTTPRAMPTAKKRTSTNFHPLMSYIIYTDDAMIRPKKNAHVCTG